MSKILGSTIGAGNLENPPLSSDYQKQIEALRSLAEEIASEKDVVMAEFKKFKANNNPVDFIAEIEKTYQGYLRLVEEHHQRMSQLSDDEAIKKYTRQLYACISFINIMRDLNQSIENNKNSILENIPRLETKLKELMVILQWGNFSTRAIELSIQAKEKLFELQKAIVQEDGAIHWQKIYYNQYSNAQEAVKELEKQINLEKGWGAGPKAWLN